jgi:hypothetical protein
VTVRADRNTRLAEIRERVNAAESEGNYGYEEEARSDVRWLVAELEAVTARETQLREALDIAAAVLAAAPNGATE